MARRTGGFLRILVVGAGAIGGYFGGRLLAAGQDVTFLVRPRRAAELAHSGLVIRSCHGDVILQNPPAVQAQALSSSFDLVVLSCKAYDLEDAMASLAPAVGPETAILPLLNGMRHLDLLDQRFGRERVLGGQCLIAASLNAEREIVHLNDTHAVSFGERDGALSDRVQQIARCMAPARFEVRPSREIVSDMWAKWVFLASLAGGTCLMRAAIGDIVAAHGGAEFLLGLVDECRGIAASQGYPVPDASLTRTRNMLTAAGSTLTSSMLRDVQRNQAIEADHIIGDLLRRGNDQSPLPLLRLVQLNLRAYEARRCQ